MAKAAFVHLHNHSNYSLLDGLSKIDEMVRLAKEYEMPALAVTDHGNLYGAIEFYQICQKHGLKPIIGLEAYLAARSRFDKEPNLDGRRTHLTLLARDRVGYQNLIKLVTASNLEGYYYKPRVDLELLRRHHEGLICLSGCLGSELSRLLWNQDEAAAEALAREYQEIFGAENYFVEIMHHPKLERQPEIRAALVALAGRLKIPLVATQDAHYLKPEDAKAHDTLVAINTNSFDENKRFGNREEDFSFISPETAAAYFAETPEAVANTLAIAERCNLELTLGKFVFPNFPIPAGQTADEILAAAARRGLEARRLAGEAAAEARLARELAVIKMKGYASYFLVVDDLIRYAREHDIYYNIRGSVAGSLVTYALDITKVDPLAYQIPFERFLNPERPSAPDIDMDFADDRRDEIIAYARQKYGEDQVAQIGTFGSMLARGAVRDVARALGHPYGVGDKISRLIPLGSQGFPMTIARALEMSPELAELYQSDAPTKEIIDLSQRLEGNPRHISVHAAGVVIAPGPLADYVPLQFDPKGGKMITQYDMYAVGEDGIGLTKFDFLGLRNLAILAGAVKLIAKIQKQKVDLENLPLDDLKTFQMLARGETIGLFQLNGAGMTRWLKELKPTDIHDINAMVALYRPGPMQFIPDYIKRKHQPKTIKYLDPALEKILAPTYGVLVYQDDLLIMAHDLAGYTWGEVDKFRKAVGKKIPAEMAAQREKFIKGCIANSGWSEKKATEIWAWIEPFAAYGFNKAHAASYGRVAYQTAYLKANFPAEYMTAVLSAESGNTETVTEAIGECRRMGLQVLPPDVNESYSDFTVVKDNVKRLTSNNDKVRFGLATIKNLGLEIAEAIVAERESGGHFGNLANFLERIKHRNLNKKSLEALGQAGALDGLGEERGRLLYNLDQLVAYHQELVKMGDNQSSLFGLLADPAGAPRLKLGECPPATRAQKLAWERDLLGVYVSGHPLDEHREKFEKSERTIARARGAGEGATVIAAGLLEEVKPIYTKSGSQMAFARLADYTGAIELVFFTDAFTANQTLLAPGAVIAVKGRLSLRNGEPSIVVSAAKGL